MSEILLVERALVSVLGTAQPMVLRTALTRELYASGFVARLRLAAPPEVTRRWTDADVSETTSAEYDAAVGRLLELEFAVGSSSGLQPRRFKLSPSAHALWVTWFDEHNRGKERFGDDDDRAAAARHEELPARLALILHLMRSAGSLRVDAADDAIDEASMRSAIDCTRWFQDEEERVYGLLRQTKPMASPERLIEALRSLFPEGATARDVHRWSRTTYTTSDEARAALEELARAGIGDWIDRPSTERGGRRTRTFVMRSASA